MACRGGHVEIYDDKASAQSRASFAVSLLMATVETCQALELLAEVMPPESLARIPRWMGLRGLQEIKTWPARGPRDPRSTTALVLPSPLLTPTMPRANRHSDGDPPEQGRSDGDPKVKPQVKDLVDLEFGSGPVNLPRARV